MNIILDNAQRQKYASVIEELRLLCPETISRKIPEANVQQAFVFDMVKKLSSKNSSILSVGCFEDTAYEALLKSGYSVVGIDPAINVSLDQFKSRQPKTFDTIFSTSVIEHVENDEDFIGQMCNLLNVGGYGILTCDFNDNYKPGDGKPSCDHRLYTKLDLLLRLSNVLSFNGCELFGEVNYNAAPDFIFDGINYSFATFVFKKTIC